MAVRRFGLALAVGLLWLPLAARAIIFKTETGGRRVGYVVRDDGKKLSLRYRGADGKNHVDEYDRAKIEIIFQVEVGRLEKLSSANPKAYRDYAEELTRQKEDPEARDTAMRLFLVAAYLDPQQLGHDCLLRMSLLASTPAQARRCRAMAFLLDPNGDASVLKTDAVQPAQAPKVQPAALQDFLKALRCYRQGLLRSARLSATREGVEQIFSMAPGKIDQKTFLQMCADATCATCSGKGQVPCDACGGTGVAEGFGQLVRCTKCNGKKVVTCPTCQGTGCNPALPDDVLRRVVGAELWAVDQLSDGDAGSKKKEGGETKGSGETNWSSLLQAHQLSPVSPLSLETITEFDPRKCLYRKGTWVAR